MNQDSKRSNPGPLMVKPESEDRKPSSAAAVGKKIVIKSADMFGDMQKEAVDIAIAVGASFSTLCLILNSFRKYLVQNLFRFLFLV